VDTVDAVDTVDRAQRWVGLVAPGHATCLAPFAPLCGETVVADRRWA